MLYDIDPRLNAEILYALALMGHGDCLAIVDANFPAASTANSCIQKKLLRMDVGTTAEAVDIIAGMIPLEEVPGAAGHFMRMDADPDAVPPVVREVMAVVDERQTAAGPLVGLDRLDFYDQARKCFAILCCKERRFYGSVILRKGVIYPPVSEDGAS